MKLLVERILRDYSGPQLSAAVFAGVAAFQRFVPFLLLPLLTAAIGPKAYGELSMMVSLSGAVVVLLNMGLDFSVFRGYFDREGSADEQWNFVQSAWRVVLAACAGCALIFAAVGVVVWIGFGVDASRVCLAVFGAASYVAGITIPLVVFRAATRLRSYVTLLVFSTIVTNAAIAILVLFANLGVTGWLIGTSIGNLLTFFASLRLTPFVRRVDFRRGDVSAAIALGLPLVPHFLASWALQLADRLVLSLRVDEAALGVYSFAATFALVAVVAQTSLNQAMMPTYARAGQLADGAAALRATVTRQLAAVALLTVALTALLPVIVRIVAAPGFSGSAGLVLPLVVGYGFLGAYYVAMNGMGLVGGRTRGVWKITASSAAASLIGIYFASPILGLSGAAWAAAGGYLLLLLGMNALAYERGLMLRYERSKLARVALVAIAAVALIHEAHKAGSVLADLGLVSVIVVVTAILMSGMAKGANGDRVEP